MEQATPLLAAGMFEIEKENDVLFIVPVVDLSELDYQRIDRGMRDLLELLNNVAIKNVILDFGKTDSYGSTALAFFLKLWQTIKMRHGHMAFCNVSEHELETLRVTNLDRLWPICSSRSEALAAITD
jgi:anti-anti-sigma factor